MQQQLSILVIEDEAIFQDIAKRMLADYHCDVADNGSNGIELYRNQQHDMVFIDINLPDMDGFDVLKEIRDINSDSYITMLTQSRTAGNVNRSIEHGTNGYIVKPFSRKQVKQCIESYYALTERKAK